MRKSTFSFAVVIAAIVFSTQGLQAQEKNETGKTRFILAASWQPAFCATNQRKPECGSQTKDRHDATNFSLHGLWPMRQNYCNVPADQRTADKDGDWNKLPEVKLSADTQASLAKVMPGMQSGLERHEWIKHGTCVGLAADEYFNLSLRLMSELNASAVRDLFAANIGKTLKAEEVKQAFDKSFGAGAGDRVKMSCRRVGNVRMISELTIGLSEDAVSKAGEAPQLGHLIQKAGSTTFGCNEGVVDAVGS